MLGEVLYKDQIYKEGYDSNDDDFLGEIVSK